MRIWLRGYDVVYGFIADDRTYKAMTNFFRKTITDLALIKSLSSLDLGKQYVCKTEKACSQIEIIKEKDFSPLELSILRDRSALKRKEEVALTENTLTQYRREGRFFDEVLRGE